MIDKFLQQTKETIWNFLHKTGKSKDMFSLKSMTAMRKLVDTQSIVSIIDYLVSDDSHCITGENIHINAGIV